MLPAGSRLKLRSDFRSVYSKGRSCATDLIVVYVLPNRRDCVRFGFSVSRKIGSAVVRNRVRRLLREAARALLPSLSAGYDVVVIARAAAAGASLQRIREDMATLLRRCGVLQPRV